MTGSINVSVSVSGHVITAAATGATYQWLDCDDELAPIPGAVSQSYTTTVDGNYAVQITVGDCSARSECVEVVTTGISTAEASLWSIYPNPVADELVIDLGGNSENLSFGILDATGRFVRQGNVIGKAIIQVPELAPGIYLLQLGAGDARWVKVFEKN
jgi:hypothetical protein